MFASKSKEVADEYISSLSDLTINSKPLINMLTMLAEDNIEHAPAIVQAVETHLQKLQSAPLCRYNDNVSMSHIAYSMHDSFVISSLLPFSFASHNSRVVYRYL
ncbi:pre-mRNA cleavage complex 2 protein Pcf11-like isoform X2 [Pogonomyrmex barbatus]|uniref:Pre-mRNA cleavage complex 2 protein Pcf11-like isoform X2 n=1 Tax=Pogonomyrmex barbatus TaxID=144034 RepID=A0A6I9WW60_9HYME|nr:pre-mRNA cleavage complex 2 protein Pcf11-like isoform X2 [Pogonomyrmex barbatus]